MRLFVALNLPEAERHRLFMATAALRERPFPFRWVPPESVHLTLRFLGEVADSAAAGIREALVAVAGRHVPAELEIGGVGAFPNLRRPRILWIGADGGDVVYELQADVESVVADLGFRVEPRAWSPHLTLARARSNARPAEFAGLEAAALAVDLTATIRVESIDLMRSHPGPSGARYEIAERVRLHGAQTLIT